MERLLPKERHETASDDAVTAEQLIRNLGVDPTSNAPA